MKKNKNIAFIIFGVVALVVLTYLAYQKQERTNTLDTEDISFAIADTAHITTIFIANKDGKRSTFRRISKAVWELNDRYIVSQPQINLLLSTLHDQEVKRPLAKEERAKVLSLLSGKNIKVEVYVNKELYRTFYVGSETNDMLGTYYMLEGSNTPYVVHMPSFNGYLTTRFNIIDNDVRSKRIFGSQIADIKSIDVNYNGQPTKNFSVKTDNGYFGINGVENPDSAKLTAFIKPFQGLYVLRYIGTLNPAESDSLDKLKNWLTISLTDANPKLSASLTIKEPDSLKQEDYLGYLNKSKEYVYIRRENWETQLVDKSYFIKGYSKK